MGNQRGSGQFVTHESEAEVEPGLHAALLTPDSCYLRHPALLEVCVGACGVSGPGCGGLGQDRNKKGVHWAPNLTTVSC